MAARKRTALADVSTAELNNELFLRAFKPQDMPVANLKPDLSELLELLEKTKERIFERGDTTTTAAYVAMLVCVALYGEADGTWLAQRLR